MPIQRYLKRLRNIKKYKSEEKLDTSIYRVPSRDKTRLKCKKDATCIRKNNRDNKCDIRSFKTN